MHTFSSGSYNCWKTYTIVPAHATYIDCTLGKAEYRLVAFYGPFGPQSHGDNATFFEKIFDEKIFNTKKQLIFVRDWNVGLFPKFEYHNYADGNNNRTKSRKQITAGNKEFILADIFRYT